mmetsp:Transcript_4220/g.5641  ORF Transcript_4220/g.5641 Transcript_4220/m.5641 type:complete len:520 (-) Transcript_4220:1575-3134(-)
MGSRANNDNLVVSVLQATENEEEAVPKTPPIRPQSKRRKVAVETETLQAVRIPTIPSVTNIEAMEQGNFPKLSIDVRVHRSLSTDSNLYSPTSSPRSRRESFLATPQLRTAIFHHEDCLKHRSISTHQEAPERVSAIFRKLRGLEVDSGGFLSESVHIRNDVPCATRAMLEYAHSRKYVDFVYNLHQKMNSSDSGTAVPFTPRVQRQLGRAVKDEKRCDTFFSSSTLKAALRGAGAVTKAIDTVVNGTYKNAFVAVRPPGHHAGLNGLLQNATSCGFCIFNNVAIGAKHALTKHSKKIQRVAIVDIDVHHGNGTEEIVKQKFCDPDSIFFASIHLYDSTSHLENGKKNSFEFYPGSGKFSDTAKNVLNIPITPLWKKPRRSKRGISALSTSTNPDFETYSEDNMGASGFRKQVTETLVPALKGFKPDIILISAGFDTGKDDIGCCKWEAGASCSGMDLQPEDYEWTTVQINDIAKSCGALVVSVLEGGYGKYTRVGKKVSISRESFASNVCAHIHGLTL